MGLREVMGLDRSQNEFQKPSLNICEEQAVFTRQMRVIELLLDTGHIWKICRAETVVTGEGRVQIPQGQLGRVQIPQGQFHSYHCGSNHNYRQLKIGWQQRELKGGDRIKKLNKGEMHNLWNGAGINGKEEVDV